MTSASPPRHRGSVTALDWRLLADGELGPPQKLPGPSLAGSSPSTWSTIAGNRAITSASAAFQTAPRTRAPSRPVCSPSSHSSIQGCRAVL